MRLDEAARTFLGVPFRHQGRNPSVGLDCIGLLVAAATVLGLPQVAGDSTAYGRDPAHGLLESYMRDLFGSPVSDMQPGDIVAIDFKGAIRHVGIVGIHPGGLSLIHTNFSVGKVTEARLDDRWLKRIKAVYRVESV